MVNPADTDEDLSAANIAAPPITLPRYVPGGIDCPVCKRGTLRGQRDRKTFEMLRDDYCLLCGCGARNDFGPDAAASVDLRCAGCGEVLDQDRNAARNLLAGYAARGPVPPSDGASLAGGKSVRQQRFSRRRARGNDGPAGETSGCSHEEAQNGEPAGDLVGRVEISAQGENA